MIHTSNYPGIVCSGHWTLDIHSLRYGAAVQPLEGDPGAVNM